MIQLHPGYTLIFSLRLMVTLLDYSDNCVDIIYFSEVSFDLVPNNGLLKKRELWEVKTGFTDESQKRMLTGGFWSIIEFLAESHEDLSVV